MISLIVKVAVAGAILYATLVLGAWLLQRQLMYHPDTVRVDPGVFGLTDIEEIVLKTPDQNEVLAWWGQPNPGKPTLLYFHGNAGSLVTRGERLKAYHDAGYGIFMMTYRGYSGSTGKPSERANVADAKLAYDWLIGKGVSANDIVIYGESLGTGVATQVAAAKPVGGVILDAPYTTMVDVAEIHYPYLPARWFMTDRYSSRRYIGLINAPLLIVHGAQDGVIPATMGRQLFEMAKQPKQFALIEGAGHNDHWSYGSQHRIFAWLAALTKEAGRTAAPAAE